MKKKNKKKKRYIGLIFAIVICTILIPVCVLILPKLKNNEKDKLIIDINKEISVKLNEEYYNTDSIKSLKNGEIITDKVLIDTSKTGTFEYEIKIKDKKNNETTYKVTIKVIDDEAPTLEYDKEISITVGDKINLTKKINVKDNYDEDLEIKIEGEYDTNKVGEYDLIVVAIDSSNNEARGELKLIVKDKPTIKPNTSKKMDDGTFTTSKGYTLEIRNGIAYIDGILIANKTYYLPSSYNPGLSSTTQAQANKMFDAAKKEKGFNLYIASGFRSYSTQESIYNRYVSRDGQSKADTYSARPGHSEHQSGLAFDVCDKNVGACITSGFNPTEQAKWLSDNAHKYGFILRYPSGKTNETGYIYESWHFRYVGVDLATKLYNNGNWITLENYYGITSKYED